MKEDPIDDDEYIDMNAKNEIDSPYYYDRFTGGAQPIDIAEHLSFNLGNVVKYVSRAGEKPERGMTIFEKTMQDLEKARFYLEREIGLLKNKHIEDPYGMEKQDEKQN